MAVTKVNYKFNLEQIPQELKDAPAWVNWRLAERAQGEPTKAPISSRTGQDARNDDRSTWGPFQDALARLKGGEADGIGFEIFPPYIGIDLDNCRDPETGEITPWALTFIRELKSYAEVSPSGRGVHLWIKGQLPSFPLIWRVPVDNTPSYMRLRFRPSYISIKHKTTSSRGAFLTVTGQRLEGVPATIEERSAELGKFYERGYRGEKPHVQETRGQYFAIEDTEFIRLWNGDWRSLGCAAPSEADLALCNLLARMTEGSAAAMDTLFRGSKLYRPEWDEKSAGDGRTYGQMTIANALAQYSDREIVPAEEIRQLREENERLKQLVAELSLTNPTLKEARKGAPRAEGEGSDGIGGDAESP